MTKTYVINFGVDYIKTTEVTGTIEKAQEKADKLAECTGKDIAIYLKEKVASFRKWHPVAYDGTQPKQKKPIVYGQTGYYSDWEFPGRNSKLNLDITIPEATLPLAFSQIENLEEIDSRSKNVLRLLTEEMFSMMDNVLASRTAEFGLVRDNNDYELKITVETMVGEKEKKEYMSISTDGKNQANKGIIGKMKALLESLSNVGPIYPIGAGMLVDSEGRVDYSYMWAMSKYMDQQAESEKALDWDGMEKSIIANFADDVLIGVRNNMLEMTIKKSF